MKPDKHTLLSRRLIVEVSDWVATYTEVALNSMEHHELVEIMTRYSNEMRPNAQPPSVQPDSAQAIATPEVLDAMDRLFYGLMAFYDDDANNMPEQILNDYIDARDWVDQQQVGWTAAPDGEGDTDLADHWPRLDDVPDGEDILRDRHGPPTGI